MKKSLLIGTMIRFAFPLLLLLLSTVTATADQIQIGVILPLTGGAASNGESIKNSIVMADENYDREDRVRFIFEDDQFIPQKTVSAAKKLLSKPGVEGLIVFGSPTSLSVTNLAESAKVPMVAMSVVDGVVEGKSFVVKHWVTAEQESERLNREVIARGYNKIAVVSSINDAMLKLRDLFKASTTAEVVLDEEFQPSDTDFRIIVARIKKLSPDAVYVLLWAPQPSIFAKQLRTTGYKGDIFGAHNIEDPNEVAASEGALHGAWLVTGDDHDGADYYHHYKNKYGELPANGGINAYDIAKLVIEGIRSGDLNKYLHSVRNFQGAYGRYGASGKNDFEIPAAIKKIVPEGFVFDGDTK